MKFINLSSFVRLFLIICTISVGAWRCTSSASSDATSTVVTTDTAATTPSTVDKPVYDTPQPINGTKKGVVEVGTSGFNSFIVTIDSLKNWKLEKAEYAKSLMKKGTITAAVIREGLKTYIADMEANGVSSKNIHFLISSGAKKEAKADQIIAELKTLGYVVNIISAEKEGEYGFRVAVPKQYQDKAYMVDIGSGNSKITWLQGGKFTTLETEGAKYWMDNKKDEEVYQDVLAKASKIPADLRNTCFIIGGVPSKLAEQSRNASERFTTLKPDENYKADDSKIQCGLNIYKAIRKGTNTSQFVFDWDANFAIGFLMDLK